MIIINFLIKPTSDSMMHEFMKFNDFTLMKSIILHEVMKIKYNLLDLSVVGLRTWCNQWAL